MQISASSRRYDVLTESAGWKDQTDDAGESSLLGSRIEKAWISASATAPHGLGVGCLSFMQKTTKPKAQTKNNNARAKQARTHPDITRARTCKVICRKWVPPRVKCSVESLCRLSNKGLPKTRTGEQVEDAGRDSRTDLSCFVGLEVLNGLSCL